jgi:hypothetical protein
MQFHTSTWKCYDMSPVKLYSDIGGTYDWNSTSLSAKNCDWTENFLNTNIWVYNGICISKFKFLEILLKFYDVGLERNCSCCMNGVIIQKWSTLVTVFQCGDC